MYFQQGGQQAQIMQIIQQYAQMNKIDPKQLMQKLQQMPAEQQQQAIQQMMQTLQQGSVQQQEQPDMEQAAMAYGGYTTGMFVDGGMIRRADGSYSKRGLWDNIRANKGSGKKPTKEMLKQESKIRAQEAAYGGVYGNGGTNNAGFDALPDYVQAKILSNMGYGGHYNPMSEMADGGESNAGMAMGQIAAMHDKLSRLQKFINSADTEVDPWVASKITLADDYLNTVADYMQYGEQQEPENEMPGASYQQGGQPDYSSILEQNAADAEKYPSAYHKDYVTGYPVSNTAGSIPRPGGFDCPPGYTKYSNGDGTFSCIMTNPHPGSGKTDLSRMTKVADDMQFSKAMQKSLAVAPTRKNGGSTFSGNAWYQLGGSMITDSDTYIPQYGEMAYGGIHLDPAKKGTFKAQATRMGMGVQQAASTILNAPKGKYSPAMRKKANFAKNFAKQMGGPVEGDVLDVTPEELQMLKQGGYNFEIID